NLKGAVLGCQAALAVMVSQGHGRIVNVVSTAALRGIPTESFYCATKWALRGFTQALAEEVASQGIAVSAILPGGVDTAFWDDAVDRQMPVSDFLTPDQVADTILSILRQDDRSVVRELVVRSLADRDFAGG
ncbi:MAG: SDR family oxidoreductase, partial [Verrucomicrobiae bacterium]|nr:SDR family oxidoreductase [Verrucomicrobiae bacterium]